MKRRNPIITFFILASFLFSCHKDFNTQINSTASGKEEISAARSKPNIILIIGDDVGREIPTYNGGQSYNTTNIDFMAANGMQFPYFFSHPDGPPSRLALITGKYNYRNWIKFGYLDPKEKTFANMLHDDAGYSTCFIGKWQYDGGDVSIHSHGFDKYLVFMPFNPNDNNGHDQFYRRYKNPYLYKDARYLTDSEVNGKYSEDMFFDYASKFIDSNKTNPFLLIYSHNLVQKPWVPTPDDPRFATWDPAVDDDKNSDTSYFPEMVAYMDKIIGKLINKVQNKGLSDNTVFIFTSDNATNKFIYSYYKGRRIKGSKDSTTYNGINIPLVVYAPGRVQPGTTDTSLVDMTDFFPTIANMARLKTTAYQPLDGTTFYDNLIGTPLKQRRTVYCYWPVSESHGNDISYVFNYDYKLYDSLSGGNFYNWKTDIYEQHPIPDDQLTPQERRIKNRFEIILQQSNQ